MTLEPKPWYSTVERAALKSSGTAYAASATLLLAFNFKLELLKRIPDLYPLIIPQNPRRNLYAPMGRQQAAVIFWWKNILTCAQCNVKWIFLAANVYLRTNRMQGLSTRQSDGC